MDLLDAVSYTPNVELSIQMNSSRSFICSNFFLPNYLSQQTKGHDSGQFV